MRARPRLSLKARAIGWLAQREHSRSELRRKLLRRARADAAADALASAAVDGEQGASPEHEASVAGLEPAIDQLLDWLEAHDYLSQSRFAAARTLFSISNASSGFSRRNSRALSLPWPIFSPL